MEHGLREIHGLTCPCLAVWRLNPSFNGIWSARIQKTPKRFSAVGLNPSFNGICSVKLCVGCL